MQIRRSLSGMLSGPLFALNVVKNVALLLRAARGVGLMHPRSGMGIGPLALLVALHDFVRFVEPPTATVTRTKRHGVKRIHRVTRTLRPPLGLGAGERVVCASLTPGDHARAESPAHSAWPILWRYKVPDTIVFCRGEIY